MSVNAVDKTTGELVTLANGIKRSAELVTVPLSKFQGSSGGAAGYLDLGVNTSSISQAFTLLEVEYGRVDGFMDKYLIHLAGASSNLNYIRVVRLTNYGQTPTITLDADKHIWMSMDTYVYIRVKAYGNFSISGTLSRTAPTGITVPIDRLIKESDLTSSVTSGSSAPITSGAVAAVKETADAAWTDAIVARGEIGDITALETTDQTDLVSAINELAKKDTSKVFTCGYRQMQIPAGDSTILSYIEMSTLIGKNLLSFAVGQGVLLQGVAKRANATVGIPFSVFLQKKESGFDYYDETDGTGISVIKVYPNGTIFFANNIDSAVTLYLNVVGINASIIEN